MDYQRIYESLIKRSKLKNRQKGNGIYYENHHIHPKCLGGDDETYNLVLLTAKEHFIAHKLLTKIYPKERGIFTAFFRMSTNKNSKHKITARDYEYAKELISNTPVSFETRKKQSLARTGKDSPLKGLKKIVKNKKIKFVEITDLEKYEKDGWVYKKPEKHVKKKRKHSKETKEKIRNKAIGRKASKKTIKILSESHKGISPSNKGKKTGPRSEEVKKRISEKMKGMKRPPRSKEHTQKIIESRRLNKLNNQR